MPRVERGDQHARVVGKSRSGARIPDRVRAYGESGTNFCSSVYLIKKGSKLPRTVARQASTDRNIIPSMRER
ncbi:MAG: hypothetical protein OXU61_01490 [Gammaproteobacteria bacterium]|nr:hypothetical protein [Gammaproteobacteria bacterium]